MYRDNRKEKRFRMYITECFGDPLETYHTNFVRGHTVGRAVFGSSNPKYRLDISSGKDVTGVLDKTELRTSLKKGLIRYRNYWDEGYWESDGCPSVDPESLPTYSLNVKNLAAIRALNKIKAVQQDFSGGTIIGEFREMVHGITHPAQALRAATDNYITKVRGIARTRRKSTYRKALSDSWLEFSFGVQPTISDINAIAESAINVKLERIRRVFSQEHAESDHLESDIWYNCGNQTWWRYDILDRCNAVGKFSIGVRERDNTDRSPLQRILASGGDLRDAIPTAYELVPYSWLLDYFTNIGQLLSAGMVSTRDVAYSAYTEHTQVLREHINHRLYFTSGYHGEVQSQTPPQAEGYREKTQRVKELPHWDLSAFQAHLPGFKTQFLNLGALFSSQYLFKR